jgi:hypothetical protein
MFRDSVLAPVFASIEEFLGRNTEAFTVVRDRRQLSLT